MPTTDSLCSFLPRAYRPLAIVLSFFAIVTPALARAAASPNIVFVFADEHRYQSMGHTEMPAMQTPTMDRMAKEGFSFSQCVSNYPVCSPYRAIVLTGRWPYQNGVTDNGIALSPKLPTVGKAFQAAGYRTGYFGKWHLGGKDAKPFGFDTSLIWGGTNTHYDKSQYYPDGGKAVQPKGYNATLMTDQALEFIQESKEKPFFLMLSLNPPHSNFTDAPPEKLALYPEGSLPYRPNYRNPKAEPGSIFSKNGYPHYEGYHAHISAVDDELNRILTTLKSEGMT
ncbi:MAG: sulfatase-like hydrolase/transferase, partial [Candidatus Hydrogenedentes bacterium]|nr:sulfatase-like hydrolase/transferase [Candidatus Hydrogenedentota bacterium]